MTVSRKLRPVQRMRGADVAAALRLGGKRRTAGLRLALRPNALAFARIALVVPKRLLPRAVDRNRVKRVIREAFRLNQGDLTGLDVVVRLERACPDRPVGHEEVASLLRAARHA